jgi:hypothetical protein
MFSEDIGLPATSNKTDEINRSIWRDVPDFKQFEFQSQDRR